MAFTVQDDNGSVVDANAYIDYAWALAYFADRGTDLSDYDQTTEVEPAIVRATDYLDQRFTFIGYKLQGFDQTTEWPRRDAKVLGRYYVNDLPEAVKEATAEYALRSLTATLNPDPDRDDTGQIVASKKEVVGPIEEEVVYDRSGAFQMPKYPAADQKLRKAGLIDSGGRVRRS